MLAVAGFYPDWFGRGEGLGNFLSYGDYPQGGVKDPAPFYLPRGESSISDLSKVHPVDPTNVTEYVTHSWYEYAGGDQERRSIPSGRNEARSIPGQSPPTSI